MSNVNKLAIQVDSDGIVRSVEDTGEPVVRNNPTKTCPRCGLVKPLASFYPSSRRSDGFSKECRRCLLNAHKMQRPRTTLYAYPSQPEPAPHARADALDSVLSAFSLIVGSLDTAQRATLVRLIHALDNNTDGLP